MRYALAFAVGLLAGCAAESSACDRGCLAAETVCLSSCDFDVCAEIVGACFEECS